ncbi:MAG: hypothetical protein AVDCRST_MAG55-823, partial [uncultured Rubrobacteraceae bacterium]
GGLPHGGRGRLPQWQRYAPQRLRLVHRQRHGPPRRGVRRL